MRPRSLAACAECMVIERVEDMRLCRCLKPVCDTCQIDGQHPTCKAKQDHAAIERDGMRAWVRAATAKLCDEHEWMSMMHHKVCIRCGVDSRKL